MTSSNKILAGAKPIPLAISCAVGLAIWFSPVPQGLLPEGWQLLAIFLATIIAIIGKAMPMGAVAIVSITLVAATGVLDPDSNKKAVRAALSGFSHHIIWLIVLAFFIARGFIKTGLGERIAYFFVKLLGKKTLGLSYGLLLADFALAPAVPSSTARGGGIIYPIIRSLAESYGSRPDDGTNRKVGAFLLFTAFQGNIITACMFLTAGASNPLMQKLAGDLGVEITWGSWALAALVPGLVVMFLIPLFIYKVYPPEVKSTPNAVEFAREKLSEMGPVKLQEKIMLATFVMLIGLWIWSKELGLYTTTSALIGLSLLLLTGVLTWNDIKNESGAWNTLTWFSALLMMATT
jgi:DASS family divalent anion:Na+ symporter